MDTKNDAVWLVSPPSGIPFMVALTAACKGREPVANLLNYFLHSATMVAKKQGINKDNIEYIDIENRTLDDIITSLNKHNKGASKKTIISRVVDLQSWEYVQSYAYHHRYRVFIKKIQAALDNPPQPENIKLRGIHARKARAQEGLEGNGDCKFTIHPKTTILPEEMVNLGHQMVNLQSQIVDLQSDIVKLQSDIVKLQSSLSSERACREALEGKIASLYTVDTVIDTVIDTVSTYIPDEPTITPPSSEETKKVSLSSEEKAIVNWYAELERRPRLSEKLKSQCAELAPHLKTLEDFKSLFDFSEKRIRGDNKTVYLGNMVNDLKAWLRTRAKAVEDKPVETQEDESKLVLWTRKQFRGSPVEHWYFFEHMTLAEAKQQEKRYRQLVPDERQKIERQLKRLERGEIQVPEGVLIATA